MKPPFQLWRTVSPKRSCACTWSRRWNRCFTPTRTATDRGVRHFKQWEFAESGAGEVIG
jgi:hypothetical protein